MPTTVKSLCRTCGAELINPTDISRNQCSDCRAKYYRDWFLKNKERVNKRNRENHRTLKGRDSYYKKYGMTLNDAVSLWVSQGCQCKACGDIIEAPSKSKSTHIDHCHTTGVVRGVLCRSCNVSLGLLREDPERIKGLYKYLKLSCTHG